MARGSIRRLLRLEREIAILALAVLMAPVALAPAARADQEIFAFRCITHNLAQDCAIGELQLSMTVSDPVPQDGFLDFTFLNSGPGASIITAIYFENSGGGLLVRIDSIGGSAGTAFSIEATPKNLPGGNTIGFRASSAELTTDSDPGVGNGVGPGESLTLSIEGSSLAVSLSDILGVLDHGTLRIGLHVQAFASGGSESFVNSDLCGDGVINPGEECDDGNLLDGDDCDDECQTDEEDECDGDVDCNDNNPCTTDLCIEDDDDDDDDGGDDDDGECIFVLNSAPCEDGDACTAGDTCSAGVCVPGGPLSCNDGNECTDDSCNSQTGCVNDNNSVPCDDGNPCSDGDTCSSGLCFPGGPKDCSDTNPCTTDLCNPNIPGGCANVNNNNPCDDGDECTVGDGCSGGSCVPGSARNCDDGNGCTTDSCESETGCKTELVQGCQPCINDDDCDDANACDGDEACGADGTCDEGLAPDCGDGNPCTDDLCDPDSGCANPDNSNPCDDSNPCTANDGCSFGLCVGGPLDCDDGNVCTDDSCNPSVPGGCVNANNGGACADGDECTVGDTCGGGTCNSGSLRDCNDHNVCTDDSCNPTTGCVNTFNMNACDDGDACTTGDMCVGGQCVGETDCEDGDPCTEGDTCVDGICQLGTSVVCPDDGNPCTQDVCNVNGGCGIPVVCADDGNVCTDDECDPSDGLCGVFNFNACDDGNPCTSDNFCSNGICGPGIATACGDGTTDDDCSEQCDDGNTENCDGCSSTCTLELGQECGDGIFNSTCEACDDGTATNGDGCDDDVSSGGNCTPSGCGNGVRAGAESCDDGNATSGDGCSASCVVESCGDNVLNQSPGIEQCDGTATGTSCDGECQSDCRCSGSPPVFCGDRLVNQPSEQCDDGNRENCDGCDENCRDESGLPDADGDGSYDSCDNCPSVFNASQNDFDGDGEGDLCDSCTDVDGDAFGNAGFANECFADNCADIPNPDQEDIDKDGFGDACDENDVEGALVLGAAKAVAKFSPQGRGKGKIVIRGVLFDHPPFDGFVVGLETGLDPESDAPDEGLILVRVIDDGVLAASSVWLRSECEPKLKRGFLKKVACKSADKSRKILFRKHPLGRDVFRFAMTLKGLSIQPFLLDKVTMVITTGLVDRPDQIGDLLPCKVQANRTGQNAQNKCKEPARP